MTILENEEITDINYIEKCKTNFYSQTLSNELALC